MAPGTAVLAALTAGAAYLPFLERGDGAARSAVKTLPLAILSANALALGAPALLAVGLGLSALGDFFLSRSGRRAFLAGLVAFLLAHLAYIAAMGGPAAGLVSAPAASSALAALGLSSEFWLIRRAGSLAWPVRAYVAVIVMMAVSAFGAGGLAALGAVFFVASDLLLAIRVFVVAPASRPARVLSLLVWITYLPGQILIFLGLGGG